MDLRSYQLSALGDPAVVALAARTRVIDDPGLDPAAQTARVKVTLNDGSTVEVTSETMKGSPEDPMSEDELLAKFHGCLDFGIGASRAEADRLADVALDLETAGDAAAAIVNAFPAPR